MCKSANKKTGKEARIRTFWGKSNSRVYSRFVHFAQSPLSIVFVPKVFFVVEDNVQNLFLYIAWCKPRYIHFRKKSPTGRILFRREVFEIYSSVTKRILKAEHSIVWDPS